MSQDPQDPQALHQQLRDRLVQLGLQDLLDLLDQLDQLAQRDLKAYRELLDQLVPKEFKVSPDPLDLLVLKASKVSKASLDLQDLWVPLDPQDLKGFRVPRGRPVRRDRKVSLVQRVRKVFKVLRDQQDRKA